jgi:molybdate transport system regulatory protein
MRIRTGDTVVIGPGKIALLEAVPIHGSISAAARSLGMSYQCAWRLLDELNQSLKSPATVSEQGGQRGGGCTLTAVSEQSSRWSASRSCGFIGTCDCFEKTAGLIPRAADRLDIL